jgi:aryl-alcohol dehydrogenase-like predicted oxidoreductase
MIEKRRLGKEGADLGRIGYGAMALEGYYGASNDDQAIETIRCALDVGMGMIDTADAYGAGRVDKCCACPK